MKILSLYGCNILPKSNKNIKQNSLPVSFRGDIIQEAEILKSHYSFVRKAVESKFRNWLGTIRLGSLQKTELDFLSNMYRHCCDEVAKGGPVREINAGLYIKTKIQSGNTSDFEEAVSLLKQIKTPAKINKCTVYTLSSPYLERNGNFCRVLFDENGEPKVMAYMYKCGEIIHAFIPKH